MIADGSPMLEAHGFRGDEGRGAEEGPGYTARASAPETRCPRIDLAPYMNRLAEVASFLLSGRVVRVVGTVIESIGPPCAIGEVCRIHTADGKEIYAEVVGFKDERLILMPMDEVGNLEPGSTVVTTGAPLRVPVGESCLGRIFDGLGRPIDNGGPLVGTALRAVHASPPDPLTRERVNQPLVTGIRAIDGLLTCGRGQRIGIFAGSGVGKSTLLGCIARHSTADVNVIGLIGERGREVREFLERDLREEGLRRSVVVVATSDLSPLQRLRGAAVATTFAEYFRDQGLDVVLMMDSVTRFAWAQREIGLAAGEPPATRGYTPSVFGALPRLLERAGTASRGSITGFYSVLVDADDMNDPIADTVRGILDGHIVLSRDLARQGHYPAIDVLSSVSRIMTEVTEEDHRQAATRLRDLLAVYREAEDLINIGAYVSGSNPRIDAAIAHIDAIRQFLRQDAQATSPYEETLRQLASCVGQNGAE